MKTQNLRDRAVIHIVRHIQEDGSFSVQMVISGLTESESITMADMLSGKMCGAEITKQ